MRPSGTGGDEIGAAQLVVQHRQAMLNTERWYVLEKWLSMLPDSVIQQRPALLMARVWVHYFQFRHALIPSILDVIESLLNNGPKEQALYGEIYLFRGVLCFFQGDGERSLKYMEDALEWIPEDYPMIRGIAEQYWGFAGQMNGRSERALNDLSGLLHNHPLHPVRKVRVMGGLVMINMMSGNLTLADTLNQEFKRFATRIESPVSVALSSWFQGAIHFCRNELDTAIDYLSHDAEFCYIMPKRASVDCLAGLALAYQAMQQTDKASQTMERFYEFNHYLKDYAYWDVAHSCKVRLALIKGEAPFASGLPGIDTIAGGEALVIFLEIPAITQCRELIAEGTDKGLREVEKRLQELLRLCRTQHNTFQIGHPGG
jgi:LuxR family maltose regulon positive regulatory protein